MVTIVIADNCSNSGLVNNSSLNRKIASNKQFNHHCHHNNKYKPAINKQQHHQSTDGVVKEEEVNNRAVVNRMSASNKIF